MQFLFPNYLILSISFYCACYNTNKLQIKLHNFLLIYAIAERPMLTRRPKASIWLVHHHLRSLNTVNEEHYMKNMSIERIT